jgi:hypothetical protein
MSTSKLSAIKTALSGNTELEKQFLETTGLTSLDELNPANFRDIDFESPVPKLTAVSVPTAAPQPALEHPKTVVDAAPPAEFSSASDFLYEFKTVHIIYAPKKKISTFLPFSTMMMFILHHINLLLCDNFYFKRNCPDYHPYLLRIYFSVIFYIQNLRAMDSCNLLDGDQHDLLIKFLESFPPESLVVPGPLLHVFKSICSSQAEFPQYGRISPLIPYNFGPSDRSDGPGTDHWNWTLPTVSGIFDTLNILKDLVTEKDAPNRNWTPQLNSKKEKVAFTLNGVKYDKDPSKWTDLAAWLLLAPGIEYPCEADRKLNITFFTERIDSLELPTFDSDANLVSISDFLGLFDLKYSWFSQVLDVASVASRYFNGSGTLADCSPSGLQTGQIQVQLLEPPVLPAKPTSFPSTRYYMDTKFQARTTNRSVPELVPIMASASHINTRFYQTHPYLHDIGGFLDREGPFWSIRPIERSSTEDSILNSVPNTIRKMMKDRL